MSLPTVVTVRSAVNQRIKLQIVVFEFYVDPSQERKYVFYFIDRTFWLTIVTAMR